MKKKIEISDKMKEIIQDSIQSQVELGCAISRGSLFRARMKVQTEEDKCSDFKWMIDDEGMISGIYDQTLLSEKEIKEMDKDYEKKMLNLVGQMEQNR